MNKNSNQKDIYELSLIEQQMQNLEQQLLSVQKTIDELNKLNIDLDSLKGKKGREIFAHIGKGVYIKAKLVSEDFLVRIDEKNLVKKNLDNTKKLIKSQLEKLEEVKEELNDSLEELNKNLLKMLKDFEEKNKGSV